MKTKKRILLASMHFDCGTANNHMYLPLINWYFDFTNEDKPVRIVIKYAWQDSEIGYSFNQKMKELMTGGKIVSFSKSAFLNYGYNYEGEMNIDLLNDFYLSPKGHEIAFVKDFQTACKLYQ